jgi:preprotein translocase subunit SecA
MSSEVNQEIVSFLSHASLPVQEEAPKLKEGRQQKTDMSKMRANKEEIDTAGDEYAANEKDYYDPSGDVAVKQEPIKVGPKIGVTIPVPAAAARSSRIAMEEKANSNLT